MKNKENYMKTYIHNMMAEQPSAVKHFLIFFHTQIGFHCKTIFFSTLPSMEPLATAVTFYHKLSNIIWLATQTIGFLR